MPESEFDRLLAEARTQYQQSLAADTWQNPSRGFVEERLDRLEAVVGLLLDKAVDPRPDDETRDAPDMTAAVAGFVEAARVLQSDWTEDQWAEFNRAMSRPLTDAEQRLVDATLEALAQRPPEASSS